MHGMYVLKIGIYVYNTKISLQPTVYNIKISLQPTQILKGT